MLLRSQLSIIMLHSMFTLLSEIAATTTSEVAGYLQYLISDVWTQVPYVSKSSQLNWKKKCLIRLITLEDTYVQVNKPD